MAKIIAVTGNEAVAHALKQINPDVKVLLSSGYDIDGKAHDILSRGCRGFLQKPFNIYGLSRKLRDILNNVGA